MSRSPDRRLALALAMGVAVFGLAGPAVAQPAGDDQPGQVEDLVLTVEDLVLGVESLDGAELVEQEGRQVTVTLTSDVLFAFDDDQVSPGAHERLSGVADRIRADGAGGVITIAGHTDDQGSASYNQGLSERRADSVRAVLADLLAGEEIALETEGYGETRPRVPNIVDGEPDEENRARNRRVEIIYDVRQ